MDCPRCKYPNPQGSAYCQLCYEVLVHNASRRYQREIKRKYGLAQQSAGAEKVNGFHKWLADFSHTVETIDWGDLRGNTVRFLFRSWIGLALALGVVVIGVALAFFASATTRLNLYGARLDHRIPVRVPLEYFVGYTSDLRSWTERQGRLDTPLETIRSSETGTLTLERGTPREDTRRILVKPKAWIRIQEMSEGSRTDNVPLTHPSLSPAMIYVDKQGTVLKRENAISLRLGRSLAFLMPRWPKGRHHEGKVWEERTEWVEPFGEWKIIWKARFRWMVKSFEPCASGACTRLTYAADLSPHLWSIPEWARRAVKAVRFSGQGTGEVLFSDKEKQLISNTLKYEGILTIPITNVGLVPWDKRVGRVLAYSPGEVLIRFKNEIDVRKR